MRVNKMRLSEDTGTEACELGGEAMDSGFHIASSLEVLNCAVDLVFTFDFVWLSCAAIGTADSPQEVCSGSSTDAALDGLGVCTCSFLSVPESVWQSSHQPWKVSPCSTAARFS
jgi:hypothetical protein